MSQLSVYFSGIGAKRLSRVEINPGASNQHEFNGIDGFRAIFGDDRITFEGTFLYLDDNPDRILAEDGSLTWYNARANHPTRTEYRLYYTTNSIISESNVDDLVVIGRTGENKLAIIIASAGSTAEQQIKWLFGLEEVANRFIIRDIVADDQVLNFAGRYVISTFGFEVEDIAPDYLPQLLARFGSTFPSTAIFSDYARSTVEDVSAIEEPDTTLLRWLEREEVLFKTLENHIVSQRLDLGFDGNVDYFVSYSLSVHNRRKSRAGHSFENHLASIFRENEILFSRGKKTERNNKPDFLFPSIDNYADLNFNTDFLTMLGVKTSAKDRWRQILSEAERIPNKHLITLEPGISLNQTTEMQEQNLQLVIPSPLMETYSMAQREQIITLIDFIHLVRDKQERL